MTESPTSFGGRDPDGCAGAILAILLQASIIVLIVLAVVVFR